MTGGIAAGKSTIGRRLEQLGAVRIDADQLARDAVAAGTPGLSAVVARFGRGVLRSDGSLDRPALGEIVFGDPSALADLNAIVHPEVRRLSEARIADARSDDADAVIVYEIPLLVEAARDQEFDWVVTAEAPAETRVARMVEYRGMTESAARDRIASQADEAERRAIADVVVDTSGSEADTIAQADALWRRIAGERRERVGGS
nr:dephospho-CoA kinase [Leucobacter edaphi]